jgi:hypothetical protein
MWILLPCLVGIAACQMGVAIYRIRHFPHAKLSAITLLATAPWQVLIAIFGESCLIAMHTPTSFDANADGIGIFLQWFVLTVASAIVPAILLLWLSFRINGKSRETLN